MKLKLFISAILLTLFVSVGFSQNASVDREMPYSASYLKAGVTAESDTFGLADSTWTYTIVKRTNKSLTPYVYADLDSVGGAAETVTIELLSKGFSDQPDTDYTVRESASWTVGNDTTITFDSDSVHNNQVWQFKIRQDNSLKIGVDKLNFHFSEEDQ